MEQDKKTLRSRDIVGTVLSDRMDKSIVVQTKRLTVHPVFTKRIKRFNTFMAHDEKNEAKRGDVVKITQTRPLSKVKRWKLKEVLERASET